MKTVTLILLVAAASLLAACSNKSDTGDGYQASSVAEVRGGEAAKAPAYLAYEHSVSLDTTEAGVRALFDKLVSACKADQANACTVLDSHLSTGQEARARIKMRTTPAGVKNLISAAATGGDVTGQGTHVEDLARPVADSDKRLAMLTQYQKRLLDLEQKASSNVDTLIKVSRELASVQSELEQATAQHRRLLERVNLEILNFSIEAGVHRGFWTPIAQSLAGFSGNLSNGIASAVVGLAYLLPWLAAFLILMPLGRKVWRKLRRKTSV